MDSHNDINLLKEVLNDELNKRNTLEQKTILSKMITDLQTDLPADPSTDPASRFMDEHYIKSDWEIIKEYWSSPFIRWAYILAFVTPVIAIVGFVYVALWVE